MRELERGTSGNDRLAKAEFFRRGNEPAKTRESGRIAGDPREADRFWALVDRSAGPGGCWLWLGAKSKGYGRFRVQRAGAWKLVRAHRWSYELVHGPIPNEIFPDHLCHTNDPTCPGGETCPHRACVNPAHLEPVDDEENRRRARARRSR
jgi:hypothetical protein